MIIVSLAEMLFCIEEKYIGTKQGHIIQANCGSLIIFSIEYYLYCIRAEAKICRKTFK